MVSVSGPTRASCIRVRRSAPDDPGGSSSGLEHLISRCSVSGMSHPWARTGSHRFPGDPSHAFALLQDPGRAGKISPWPKRDSGHRDEGAEQNDRVMDFLHSKIKHIIYVVKENRTFDQ